MSSLGNKRKPVNELTKATMMQIETMLSKENIKHLSPEEKNILNNLELSDIKQLSKKQYRYYDGVRDDRIHLVDSETSYSSSYMKMDDNNNTIYDAAAIMSRFVTPQINRDSFLMPFEHVKCSQKINDEYIDDITKSIDNNDLTQQHIEFHKNPQVAKEIAKWKRPIAHTGPIKKTDDTPLIVKENPYSIPSYNNCHFKLKDDAVEALALYQYIEIKGKKMKNEDIEEKKYTIDLRTIKDSNVKTFFKTFVTIPPGLDKYVKETFNAKVFEDLPTYCLVSSNVHSCLYLNIPDGIQYVIGFAYLTMDTHYDGTAVKNNPQYFPEYPGRMFGIDPYYTPEGEAEFENKSNWVTTIGYITPAILDRIKNMLESVTLIKFKTRNDNTIIGSVDVCFFKSTAKDTNYENNFSYRSKFNCFGMISYILGFTLNESNYREFYTSQNKEDPPIYLKPLEYAIINKFMNDTSKTQFDTIRYIQLTYTFYGYQEDIFGPPPDFYKQLYLKYLKINFFFWNAIRGGKAKHNKTKAKHNKTKAKHNKTKAKQKQNTTKQKQNKSK